MRSYLKGLYGTSHPQEELLPFPSQVRWQNQVFKFFRKVGSKGACLTSRGMMFQRVGTTAEKTRLLDPIKWNSLTDEVHSMPSLHDQVGQNDVMGMRRSLR